MTHSVQTELRMKSRLSEMPALIQRLRSDPELLARIRGREADFLIAMREALANAVTHGNQSDGSKGVFVSYACEANETLSIAVRDEGNGFEPIHFLSPNEMREDQERGIFLIRSSMDEVQFRKNGTEIYICEKAGVRSDQSEVFVAGRRFRGRRHVKDYGEGDRC